MQIQPSMSITHKFLLNKRRESEGGVYPLVLRCYHGTKSKEASLNISIAENDWDEKLQVVQTKHPDAILYNTKLLNTKSKIQRLVLLDESNSLTLDDVFNSLFPKEVIVEKAIQKPSIISYGENQIEQFKKAGKAGNAICYSCAVNKLKAYAGNSKLLFEDVSYKFLNEFNVSLLNEGIKVNSISVYFRTIRALFNKAIKEGIISPNIYPFHAFKIKNEKTVNRTLSLDEMRRIAHLDLPKEKPIWHQRNYFLLSFYFIGINFADLLTANWKENVIDGRLIYRRKKTAKVYNIKIQPAAMELLLYYKKSSTSLLLPILKQTIDAMQVKKDVNQARKTCNNYLGKIAKQCSIEKEITGYYSRYCWSNIAKGLGYSKDLIAEGLGHEYGSKVTGIYLDNYDAHLIDEMNLCVIEAVTK